MSTITWKAAVDGNFATGANWSTGTVPGSGDIAEIDNVGTFTVTSSADESVNGIELGNDATLDIGAGNFTIGSGGELDSENTTIDVESDASLIFSDGGSLAGAGTIALAGGSDLEFDKSGSPHVTFAIDDATISGDGQIGGAGDMALINRGVIDATAANALTIDIPVVHVTNGAFGVMEGSGSGGLSITGGTFTNYGTISALDGSSVTFGPHTVNDNDAGGMLYLGHWYVTDMGRGAAMTLTGTVITKLAAKIVLSGANSQFVTGGSTPLEDSLATIVASNPELRGGSLELLNGRGWASSLDLTDDAQLQIAGGTFDAAGLTVGSAGTVTAVGTIASPMTDDGLVIANRGALDLTGTVTGTGVLKLLGASTLTLGSSLASTVDVLFGTGTHETLALADPRAFASTLTDWGYGDSIDLLGTDATSAQISGDTLTIDVSGGSKLNYTLADASSGRLVLASDGAGGTKITLNRSADSSAVARIAQAMAALPAAAPAGTPRPTDNDVRHLESIAASRA